MSLHPITEAMEKEARKQARRHRATMEITPIVHGIIRLEAYAPAGHLWAHNHRPWIELQEIETAATYSALIEAMAKGTYRPK